MHVLELPQMKGPADRALLRAEFAAYIRKVEELTGVAVTPERLARGIRTVNAKRRALNRLNALRAAVPAPISGRDVLLINQVSFYDDPERFTAQINALCDELEARVARREGVAPVSATRLMLSGCPMAVPNWKLPYLVESSGAVIVGEESCVGTRNTRDLVDESGNTLDAMLDALVDRYMRIDCACFTPNTERLDNVLAMADALQADGVIHYGLLFCTPYAIEAKKIERVLIKDGIPMLSIETDYSMEDAPALKTRVEAFVEMIGPAKKVA